MERAKPPKILKASERQKTGYCIPAWLRDIQIKHALTRVKRRVVPYEGRRTDPVAIVGFGPSLRDTWEKVRDFKYVISCSGSHKFLLERGIVPTWHIEVDPRPHKVQLMGPPHKDVEYWISSTCHKDVFDHLEGHKIVLWHVFDPSVEKGRFIPAGEWGLVGGCDVGLRALTCAGTLGFRDLHIFGLDGSDGEDGRRHAADHPNDRKGYCLTEYPEGSGKMWRTTPALLEAARYVTHELDQIPAVTAKFYGDGLIPAMVRDWKPKVGATKMTNVTAMQRPALITPEFKALNAQLHADNAFYGAGGHKHAETVVKLIESTKAQSVLDYGCGKGTLGQALSFPIWEYDPAIPGKDELPRPADLVVCLDVLEHIEPECLPSVLAHLAAVTRKVGYFVIHTGPARKVYADGRNAHLIQQGKDWWAAQLAKYFTVGQIVEAAPELRCIVGPRAQTAAQKAVVEVALNGTRAKYVVTNEKLAWRVKTLFTKEPHTIAWVHRMLPGEKLWDVGANMGGYSVWAAARGVHVTAFEPESQNFAALCENLATNQFEFARGYPLALAERAGLNTLYLSQVEAGGSCHSLGEQVGPDLTERKGIPQGAVATTLDAMGGALGMPNYVKIDVDGMEHNVIAGGATLLASPVVQSLIVEVNTNLPAHQRMVEKIKAAGFHVDPEQVAESMRKDGTFKGCAEHIFRRIGVAEKHLLRAIEKAKVVKKPFPHIYVTDVFPPKFYAELLAELNGEYKPIAEVRKTTKGYPERFMVVNPSTFWQRLNQWMTGNTLRYALLRKFGLPAEGTRDETLLLRDMPGYALGPHTDATFKRVSAVFYLAKNERKAQLGTSIYVPKKAGFRCPGGPHHDRKDFKLVRTMPYVPNSLIAFAKTDNSFHGVEPTTAQRDVLIYDIRKDDK